MQVFAECLEKHGIGNQGRISINDGLTELGHRNNFDIRQFSLEHLAKIIEIEFCRQFLAAAHLAINVK